jgi:hypothetical protein
MNLVYAVKNRTEQLRATLFLGTLNRSELIYVHSYRISTRTTGGAEKYRVTILVRANNVAEAEELAESHLNEVTQCEPISGLGGGEIKRLKPRPLGLKSLKGESDTVLKLLARLRREASKVVSSMDRI